MQRLTMATFRVPGTPGRGLAAALALALAAATAPTASAADGDFSVTLGLRTGSTTQDIAGGFESTSVHYGGIVDLGYKDFGLSVAGLFANYDPDAQFTVPLPDVIPAIGGPSSIRVPADGNRSGRRDVDVALKYRLHKYVTPFIGYRNELLSSIGLKVKTDDPQFLADQAAIGSAIVGAVQSGALTPEQAAAIQQQLDVGGLDLDVDLNFDFFVFGSSFSYPIPEAKLVPYVVATGFGWVGVEEEDSGDRVEESFPGYAVEGGLVFLLGSLFDVPELYVAASVKWQDLESDKTFDFIKNLFPGAEEELTVTEEVLNTNVALFYRFDL